MFADEADAAVDAFPARSGNFRAISPGVWTLCVDLEKSFRHVAQADRVLALRLLAQELVELRADQEDDRRDVEVRRDDDQQEQVPRRGQIGRASCRERV